MKFNYWITFVLSCFLFSCTNNPQATTPKETAPEFQNKGHQLVYDMVQKVGDYNDLLEKKDVVYTYTYEMPDGKADISTEKYIFDGERSYGGYSRHDRAYPDVEGLVEQGYDGSNYWLKYEGKYSEDKKMLERVKFNRPTNFYWFAMMQKLLDPDLNYEYLGTKQIDDQAYDIVKVSFNSTPDKPTDIYQLYINKETSLVDQFLFTVADFGRMEPLLMEVAYEKVDGILIPSKRRYKSSNWDAEPSEDPWISVSWTDIKFDNGLSETDFEKK